MPRELTKPARMARGSVRAAPLLAAVAGFMVACVFFGLTAVAQTNATAKVRGFNVPVYYPPPFETQLSTLLQGSEAEPGADGRVVITDGRIQNYSRAGKLDMTVQAPHCVLHTMTQEVTSEGPLTVRSSDARLVLTGEGFLWQQTNSNLVISNRVRTVILSSPDKPFRP